jgi:hypothetical protein
MPVAVASGTVSVTGSAAGRVHISAVAPQITPTPWAVIIEENGVTIVSFPAAPIAPDWAVSVLNGKITADNFPRDPIPAVPIENVAIIGSATVSTNGSKRRAAEIGKSENGGKLI